MVLVLHDSIHYHLLLIQKKVYSQEQCSNGQEIYTFHVHDVVFWQLVKTVGYNGSVAYSILKYKKTEM